MIATPENTASLRSAPISTRKGALPLPWWGRIETLWLLMTPLCAMLFALALPLSPNDLWYHVRAGEFIARGSIPTQNLMSLRVPLDTPFYYQSWLAEWLLFQTLRCGGLSGLMLMRAACLGAALGCACLAAFRGARRAAPGASPLATARWVALSGVLGLALLSNNIDLRPQSFSVLFFGLWLLAVGEFRAQGGRNRLRWAAFLVILTLIWANTHGAFATSLLGLAALALGDALGHSPRTKSSLWLLGWCVAAVALNPRGLGLFSYVAQLSNNEIGQRFIGEWKSPGLDEWHSILFWLTVCGLSIWLLKSRRARQNWGEIAVLTLFFGMAARDQRSVIWFALAMMPMLASLGAARFGAPSSQAAPVPRAAQFINAVLLILLLLSPLALFPGVKANLPWPAEFRRRFAPTSQRVFPADPPLLLENTTAVVAADFLIAHPPRRRLFTDMVCGSYLTYATFPRVKAWCDPRIELFPTAFWEDYLQLSSGPPDAAKQLEQRGFSDALLDRQTQPGLVKRLGSSVNWKIVAAQGTTVLFRRVP